MASKKDFKTKFKSGFKKTLNFLDKSFKNKLILLPTIGVLCLLSSLVVFNAGYLLGKSASYMDFVEATDYTTYKSSVMNNSVPFQYYSEARFQSIHIDGNDMYIVDANTKTKLIRSTTTGSLVITKCDLNGKVKKAYELDYAALGLAIYEDYKLDGFSSRYGGFYFGQKYNYLVITGMDIGSDAPINSVISKTDYANAPAYRIVKYNKNFKALDYLDIPYTANGNNITRPLGFATVSIDENSDGSEICVSSGKEGIGDNNGAGTRHQQGLQFIIDTKTMTLKSGIYQNFVSHSLNQYILYDGDDRLYIDMSDNGPHGVVAFKQSADLKSKSRTILHTTPATSSYWLMYMNLGGIAIGKNNYLAAWSTMDNSSNSNPTGLRDIEVCVLSKNLGSFVNITIEDYNTDATLTAGQPYLVPINNDKFVVLWQEYTYGSGTTFKNTCYAVIDSNGTILKETTRDDSIVLNRWCIPTYCSKQNKVVWFTDSTSGRTYHKLSVGV